MVMDSFCASPGTYTYKIFEGKNLEMVVAIIGIFLIVGTIIGVIIDGIQHITITECFEKIYYHHEQRKNINEIYTIIDSILLEKFTEGYNINEDKKTVLNKLDGNKLLGLNFYIPLINLEKFSYILNEY